MELIADRATVAGPHVPLLPPTSLVAPPRRVTMVTGPPGTGLTTLALALGGRIRLAAGAVLLDGEADARRLRRHVQLVDVTDVSAPLDEVPVAFAASEQLALAGRPSGRAPTHQLLAERGLEHLSAQRFESVEGPDRAVLLMDAAAQRTATRVLVLGEPDRFGGDPSIWWARAEELAQEGLTVVVLCASGTASQLDQPVRYRLGEIA
ncbi:MAG: hypothetical protein LWW86_04290 [Micrococcales bacterium]|nr:hypothetical protein [Micrococcales bacterium]